MDAVPVKHCISSIHGRNEKFRLVSRNWNGGLRFKERDGSAPSVLRLRGGEFSIAPLHSEWCTRQNSSNLLHFHSLRARQRVYSLSQKIHAADRVVNDEHTLLIDEEQKLLLERKAAAIVKDLKGTCIYLVGMMGSGKSTVGKHIAEALGYYFFDSDKLVEEAAGGITVAQMFRAGKEEEFRNAETEVLMQLSSLGRLVVATGGGAVIRPQNWGYLRHGITVWLDVPLEALAQRVVAVGCESRPLLGEVSPESAYKQALECLTHLFEERLGYYSNADAAVSVAALAAIMGVDVHSVTPTMLAIQVLEEIHSLIKDRGRKAPKF